MYSLLCLQDQDLWFYQWTIGARVTSSQSDDDYHYCCLSGPLPDKQGTGRMQIACSPIVIVDMYSNIDPEKVDGVADGVRRLVKKHICGNRSDMQ